MRSNGADMAQVWRKTRPPKEHCAILLSGVSTKPPDKGEYGAAQCSIGELGNGADMAQVWRKTQPDYDAALAEIEAAYPGINDDGSCLHGERYDACPTCSPPQWQDTAP